MSQKSVLSGCGLFSIGLVVFGVVLACGVGGCLFRKADEQFGIDASVSKYEWFKDAAAKLEAKQANISAAESRLAALDEQYKGVPRKDWPRADLEQSNVWRAEVSGMKAGFNDLAAEFNARMAKANYRYANVGDLPAGADKPLPREFKPYEDK